MKRVVMSVFAALLCMAAQCEDPEEDASWIPFDVAMSGGARAYVESAYFSSSGTLSYTKPVAEQTAWLTANMGSFGYLTTDGWLCSILNGQTDHVHRRAFYCYEGTVRYGYVLRFTDSINLDTNGGLLWDWLGGYEHHPGTPLAFLAMQHFRNPFVTPYWNLLHRFDDNRYVRIRCGVERAFEPVKSVTVRPFAEMIWGDAARYRRIYGESPSYRFLNGSFMVCTLGAVAEWRITENWYLWGRFRQFLTINQKARSLAHRRDTIVHHTDYSIYSIGVGCRF